MFVVKKSNSYFWPVTIETPENGGQFKKESFEVEFKRLPSSEVKKIFTAEGMEEKKTDADFCRENVINWKGVKAEDGSDLNFSLSNLDLVLEIPGAGRKIVEAFMESLAGSRLKNS